MKPVVIDLFCGLGGWAEGFLAEGYEVIGFDIERRPYPGQLVLQDALTLHGSQFRKAACIVASPPCTEYSYMAMPWSRAKQIARAFWGQQKGVAVPFPDGYTGSHTLGELNALFNACVRIQREASEAAGRYVPMVVENVKGAQPWVGRAKWHYGSFYLWGDVPALMPFTSGRKSKVGSWDQTRANYTPDHGWDGEKVPGFNFHEHEKTGQPSGSFQSAAVKNNGGSWFNQAHNTESGHGRNPVNASKVPGLEHGRFPPGGLAQGHIDGQNPDGRKQEGSGATWFDNGLCKLPSGSSRRAQASAKIAMIPFPLAQYIARTFYPCTGCAQ